MKLRRQRIPGIGNRMRACGSCCRNVSSKSWCRNDVSSRSYTAADEALNEVADGELELQAPRAFCQPAPKVMPSLPQLRVSAPVDSSSTDSDLSDAEAPRAIDSNGDSSDMDAVRNLKPPPPPPKHASPQSLAAAANTISSQQLG